MAETSQEPIRRLPAGPHGLPPELVERNQRERLVAATAEVCGERGYAESSIAEIAKRAGVSTASFYRQFADKRECALFSFEQLSGRLLAVLEEACGDELSAGERTRLAARTAAPLLAADPPTARLLSIEILAVGEEGVTAQHEAIERLACLLSGSAAESPPALAPWAVAAAMVSLIGRRAATGDSPSAAELEALASLL